MDYPVYLPSTQTRQGYRQLNGVSILVPGGDIPLLCTRSSAEGTRTPGRRSGGQLEISKAPCSLLPGIREELSPMPATDAERSGLAEHRLESSAPGDGCSPVAQRWMYGVVPDLSAFWPVPTAILGFFLAVGTLGHVAWAQVLPGVQAIWLMSVLQYCWALMAFQGRRYLLRLTQLTAAFLGVLMLLPKRDFYGRRIWASAFDDEGGVILPGFATSLAQLFGLLPVGAEPTGEQAGYELPEDAEYHSAQLLLEVSLAAVFLVWLLQAVIATWTFAAGSFLGSSLVGAASSINPATIPALKSHHDLPALEVLTPTYDVKLRSDPRASPALDPLTCEAGMSSSSVFDESLRSPRRSIHPDTEQQQHGKWITMASSGQRVLLVLACMLQCISAVAIVGTWKTFAQRLQAEDGVPSTSARLGPENLLDVSVRSGASWISLALLTAAMSGPLLLPSLLRSRHLLHTALLLRPAATRTLGLLLLDVNAAKLLLAVAVGGLGGWRAGVLTWQMAQVMTMMFGITRLYVDALRAQAQLMRAAGPCSSLAAVEAPPVLAAPARAGCDDAVAGLSSLTECVGARVSSPRITADTAGRVAAVWHESSRTVPDASPAVLAGCAEVACATTASTGTSAGGSSCSGSSSCTGNALRSPYSSRSSLASTAETEPHAGPAGAACYTVGSPSGATTATAQLARRPPPLICGGHQGAHSHYHQVHVPTPSTTPASAVSNGRAVATATRRSNSARGCSLMKAAVQPWTLFLASLSVLASMLWIVLIAPPLALLGDESVDFFEGLMDTGPGGLAMLLLLTAMSAASTLSVACLVWCIASGELRQRWRLYANERRRLECLSWACGPPLAVAAFSALSWALGDDLNAVPYVAAEVLRCAALWPLLWLQEPWLIGGVDGLGGCVQHAHCGVTCCVLRWCGVRPSCSAAVGARCDEKGRETEAQLLRATSRRGRSWSLQVEVN